MNSERREMIDSLVQSKKERKPSNIIKNMKVGIKDFTNGDGTVKRVEDVSIVQYKMNEEQVNICLDITKLLLESRLLYDITKMYLLSNNGSLRKFITAYNSQRSLNNEKAVSYNTAQTKVFRDEEKLREIFEMEDPYLFIEMYNINKNKADIERMYYDLKSKISQLNCIYSGDESKVYGQMLLSINKNAFNSQMGEDDFNEFIETIKWYSKKVRDNVEAMISDEEAGYFNYLLNSKTLSDVELDRKRMIEGIFLPVSELDIDDIDIEE